MTTREPEQGRSHFRNAGQSTVLIVTFHELVGSTGRRGNPYDNAKAKSFMKTLKVECEDHHARRTIKSAA